MADEILENEVAGNFIHDFIKEDIAEGGRFEGIQTQPKKMLNMLMQ